MAMGEILQKILAVVVSRLVAAGALVLTGAHPGSMRFSVVSKLGSLAAVFYVLSRTERLTSSGFWVEARADNPQRSPIIFLLLALVVATISLICFFAIGNDA